MSQEQTTSSRQQTFHWLCLDNLPIDEFYKADVSFIRQHLAKHLQREVERDGLVGALLSFGVTLPLCHERVISLLLDLE